MDLSVIIVNYNVRFYLEQCISSVEKATTDFSAEVFVVDNNSSDGSVEMVKKKFPWVNLIENKENVGFSKANNQALEVAKGRYALLLNPDTVVAGDAFSSVIDFMDKDPKIGGVGVRMVDGRGRFLPESKRGLPTPMVAFFKISGLSRIFPKNKLFGKYHLGHLPEFETNEIEILSGACMFLRMETLEKVGLLDNSFFMYGEDIDLSYRITLGGYKNYYFPDAQVIHYKGESTKKSSFNYVYVFYNAMAIFARKHFAGKGTGLFALLIDMAIYASAGAALLARTIRRLILPIMDAVVVFGGILLIEGFLFNGAKGGSKWEMAHMISLLVWIITIAMFGGYDRPIKLGAILKGTLTGTAILFISLPLIRSFGSVDIQFLITGTIWTLLTFTLSRTVLHLLKVEGYSLRAKNKKRFLVVGSPEESKRVSDLIWQINYGVGHISTLEPKDLDQKAIRSSITRNRIDSVVFCAADVTDKEIIELIQRNKRSGLEYKIARPESEYLIGSNSIESLEDLFILDINSVQVPRNKRNKRSFDIFTAFVLLITSPLNIWAVEHKGKYLLNLFDVIRGKRTWVGYSEGNMDLTNGLPRLKKAVLDPTMEVDAHFRTPELARRLNTIYAKDYTLKRDLKLLLSHFSRLGEQQVAPTKA